MKSDVVVVGSGAAGLMAALTAADSGATVTLLERSPLFGGTSADSGGALWVPNNPLQARLGIRDSPEDAERYLRGLTHGRIAENLIEAMVRAAPQMLDFYVRVTGVQLVHHGAAEPSPDLFPDVPGAGVGRSVGILPYELAHLGEYEELVRHPIWPGGIPPITWPEMASFEGDRWGWVPLAKDRIKNGISARGHALVASLLEACIAKGVKLITNARANALNLADGTTSRVTGVSVLREGKSENHEARLGVVLACGGFEWNQTMWDDLVGLPLDGRFSPSFNEGDGLRMAMQIGARVGGLDAVYLEPTTAMPGDLQDGKPRLRVDVYRLTTPGSIVVNERGERFANEAGGEKEWVLEMTGFDPLSWGFPNMPAFQIFDRENRESLPLARDDWTFDVDGDARPDWLSEAPTIRQLAEQIGVDPHGLERQVTAFNRCAERGEDPRFHRGEDRGPKVRPLGSGPYYAYRLQVGSWGTRGGPVVNRDAQVIGKEGPIPGLFAAGTTAKAVTGLAYPGGGGALGPGVTLGYIAGYSLTNR